jgi:hypothetical protein
LVKKFFSMIPNDDFSRKSAPGQGYFYDISEPGRGSEGGDFEKTTVVSKNMQFISVLTIGGLILWLIFGKF